MSGGEIMDAMRRWLPLPEYRFLGGPLDGKTESVKMLEGEDGLFPPRVWAVDEFPPTDHSYAGPEQVNVTVRRHFYRFVPGRHVNEGHYELIAEARS